MANRAQNMTEMARLSGKEPGSNLAPRPQAPQNPSGGSNHPNRARTGPSSQVSNPVRNITDPSTQNQARGSVQSYQPNGSQRSTRSRETDSSTPESTRANKRPRDENEVCCWAVHKYFEGPLENIENYCEEVVRVYASNSSRSSGHGMQYILEDCAKVQANFVVKVGENEPFVSQLLTTLRTTIKNLEPHQIHSFYESKWAEIIGQARQSVDYLKDPDVIRAVLNILQTNTSAATSLGTYFLPQITLIFLDMLNVYSMYSELISTSISQGDPYASRTSHVKLLRSVKRETLKLIETFLDKAEDQSHIGIRFVRPMMDLVLDDYARNVPETRESEVLSLFATIINKYKESMIKDVPRIFEAVFACTLEMIRENFEDYPEHRLKFLSLLQAMATHCFRALIKFSSKQIMDSIIWLSGTLNEILPKLDSTFYWRC